MAAVLDPKKPSRSQHFDAQLRPRILMAGRHLFLWEEAVESMTLKANYYRVGSHTLDLDALPGSGAGLEEFVDSARKNIEPWLSAVFQAEHLNLLLGSGLTSAVSHLAGTKSTDMSVVALGSAYDAQITTHAEASAARMGRGKPNIEDQLRSALALLGGLAITNPIEEAAFRKCVDTQLTVFLRSLLKTEQGILAGSKTSDDAMNALQSFLLSFASRAASRERLHIFTTNYDRLIEHGCDLAGLRLIDRFVGSLTPVFRSSRVEVDLHYNPPGMRGEPRFMEGVIRFTKLHGSLDWSYSTDDRRVSRKGIPFGAPETHTDVPDKPLDTIMIYPNSAKDVETTEYPYAELFRDLAAAVCRPNSVVVTYGYGFGDDHINRVLLDMLTIPSTHLVIVAYSSTDTRIATFIEKTREAQVSLLLGKHFADLKNFVENYLPKPALDYITGRMTDLLRNRPGSLPSGTPAAVAPPGSIPTA